MSKGQKKMDNFKKKKKTETTMKEQNISLSSKEIISSEPFAFKGFPNNAMNKHPASVSHAESPTIKRMMQNLSSRSNQFILT